MQCTLWEARHGGAARLLLPFDLPPKFNTLVILGPALILLLAARKAGRTFLFLSTESRTVTAACQFGCRRGILPENIELY